MNQRPREADELALLSKRERSIAARFAGGLTYREIGEALHIAPSTVRTHLATIYRKLNVRNKAALVCMVIRNADTPAFEALSAPDAGPSRKSTIDPSVAILPFVNLTSSGPKGVELDGFVEDLTTAVSQARGLLVVARNSCLVYQSKNVEIKCIARELNVGYLVEGSCRRAGGSFRISAQLIDGSTGYHLWAETYDVACGAFEEEQDTLVRSIAASVQTRIAINEGNALPQRALESQSTQDLLKRAWTRIYQFTPEALEEAIQLAESALEQGSESDRAHQALGMALYTSTALGYATDWHFNVERAYQAAERAIELFEADEFSHCVCGFVLVLKRDHEGAVAEFTRAMDINPSCTVAYGGLASALAWAGRSEEAITNNEIAIRSDPRNPSVFFGFLVQALAHFTAQRYREAAVWAMRAAQRKKLYKTPHLLRVAALAHAKELERARSFAAEVRSQFPDVSRVFVDNLPFIRTADRADFVRGLELAGVLD